MRIEYDDAKLSMDYFSEELRILETRLIFPMLKEKEKYSERLLSILKQELYNIEELKPMVKDIQNKLKLMNPLIKKMDKLEEKIDNIIGLNSN